MTKILQCSIMLFTLISCSSNLTYKAENNCSARGLAELKKNSAPLSEADKKYHQLKYAELKEIFYNDSLGLQNCYQKYLNEDSAHRDFSVCTVVTVADGQLKFLDIADQVNFLNDNLYQCLVKKFQAYDWGFLPQKKPVTISQPIIFRAHRN